MQKFIIMALFCLFSSQLAGKQTAIQGTNLQAEIERHVNSKSAKSYKWQDILQKPSLLQVKLSPNGEQLAYVLRESHGVSLWVMNLRDKQQQKRLHSKVLKAIYWSKDSQLLYLETATNMAFLRVNEINSRPEAFVKFNAINGESFYTIDDSQKGHVLMHRQTRLQGKRQQHQLIRVDINGQQTELFNGEKRIYDHLFDANGNLQFVRYAGEKQHHIYRLSGAEKQLIFTASVVDKIEMVGFNESSNELMLVGFHDADLISLHAYHISTGESRILHQDPEKISDVIGLVSGDSNEILFISYFTDRLKTYAVHPDMSAGLELINQSLDGSLSVAANLSNPYWLIRQSGALLGHPKYHMYDVEKHQIVPILSEQRSLNMSLSSAQLSESIPVSYTASDGRLIYGYVMLPKGKDIKQAPLLVYVHGGPFNRLYGGHTSWQYLVNQGYVVFMPNFRASKGYGLSYMKAGKAEFSGRVQQDIVDGVNYLLSQGISQPDKLGVLGHSFGGYSVLSLMSNYPDLFQAGFSSAGPPELLSTLFKLDQKDINRYDGIPLIEAVDVLMVDLEDEQQLKRMKANSPSFNWHKINNPLFIWAGELDKRVPIVDVKDHAIKLHKAGKPVEFLVDKNNGHNFKPTDSIGLYAYYFLIEDFFARAFDMPRPEPSDTTQEYIDRFKVY